MSIAKDYSRFNAELTGNIPQKLRDLPQWVCWKIVKQSGKDRSAKVPINPANGHMASVSEVHTWGSFDAAVKRAAEDSSLYGVGFVFTASDPFTGIDIDDCRDPLTGKIDGKAQAIIDQLSSYTEVSPSGTGVKIFIEAIVHGAATRRQKVEIYSHSRYFTVTGNRVDGAYDIVSRQGELVDLYQSVFGSGQSELYRTLKHSKVVSRARTTVVGQMELEPQQAEVSPTDIENIEFKKSEDPNALAQFRSIPDEEIIRLLCGVSTYENLWNGDTGGQSGDHSASDFALCCRLAFYTGRDVERIDRLFRQSKLFRPKWDERRGEKTYGQSTVDEAVNVQREVWTPATPLDPELINDTDNAERLVAAEGNDLLYCFELKSWAVWDGLRWAIDIGQRSRALMEKTMHAYALQVIAGTKNAKVMAAAVRCLDTHRITNGLREAEKKIGVNTAKLDMHPFLLTFTNGTLDLKSGELGQNERSHLITKMIHRGYRPEAKCPRFVEFLAHAVGEEGVDYLQKVVGYALTGITSEKKFFVIVGDGDTGKTTFLEILREIMEEYAVLLQVDTLLDRRGSDGATQEDLVSLRGARIAITSELDQGRRLSVATVKRIVQGMGQITAAGKYQKKITFDESHKLLIDTNHLPIIPAEEQALWNRLIVILFQNPVPKAQQNKKLKDELVRDEAEGIIAWAVAGELRRQREGLDDIPSTFLQEKTRWHNKMDIAKQFMQECCVEGKGLRADRIRTYQTFVRWLGGGKFVTTARRLTEMLEKHGVVRSMDRRFYEGISLNESEIDPTISLAESDEI